MIEEEKKAIEWLKKAEIFSARLYAPIILNLIEKQQKEIEELKTKNKKIQEINYRVNKDLLELAETSIRKDKIEEIIKKYGYGDCAVQKIIELLEEK